MRLSDLLVYDDIVIQCHDNPDADALASGFGVYYFLKKQGKNVRFIYRGKFQIQKSNLVLMVRLLKIPVEYAEESFSCNLLVTVDCQYGESNVSVIEAKNIAVIDHHQVTGELPELSEVRSNMGSCSTIVWDLLCQEGIAVNDDQDLATALYYGLFTDTNGFAELIHALDRDLRDKTTYNRPLLRTLRTSNLSLEELTIAGEALSGCVYHEEYQFAIVKAAPCDPNILGLISDMMLEVDTIRTCLVYSILPFGIKISVRSCVNETKASDLAKYLCEGVGGGGGHLDKAGGFIQKDLLGDTDPEKFLMERMVAYCRDSEIIYAASYEADVSSMKVYKKLPVKLGYVKAADVLPVGTHVTIRTLETDMELKISEDLYIVIGIDGEVYPNDKEKFFRSYQTLEEPYEFHGEYAPVIMDVREAVTIDIVEYAKTCVTTGVTQIYAEPVDHIVKIFTAWDPDKYMLGNPGDYMAVRTDDLHDVYIIAKDIFGRTYQEVD